ncbi:unnamed protein product, partial [Choristocarpus tenellus]
ALLYGECGIAEQSLCPGFSCESPSDGVKFNLGESPFQYPPEGLITPLTLSPSAQETSVAETTIAQEEGTLGSSRGSSKGREKRSRPGDGGEGSPMHFSQSREEHCQVRGGMAQSGGKGTEGEKKGSKGAEQELIAAATATVQSVGEQNTRGALGGVFQVTEAEVSRCVSFSGAGWALARYPNLTLQALDVFLLEALVRPCAFVEGVGGGKDSQSSREMVVLSQSGSLGLTLLVEGRKAVLKMHGHGIASNVNQGERGGDSGKGEGGESSVGCIRHETPDDVLPEPG